MITKKYIGFIILLILIVSALFIGSLNLLQKVQLGVLTQTIAIKPVSSSVVTSGSIHSTNEATLHFQTGGKLTYLPLKEGDSVFQGQTIAQLDTYALQEDLTSALNSYRSTRDTFDQTQNNANSGSLQGSTNVALNPFNPLGVSGVSVSVGGNDETNLMNNIAKRILDQNQANLDNSVINVQLANYALQLATLTSPINGTITNEDITVPGQNITPLTAFTVADLSQLVLRTEVNASDIDFISIGGSARVKIDGIPDKTFSGTIIKIYPQKITLATGEQVYDVDVQSDALNKIAKYGQNGTAILTTNTSSSVMLIPSWVILSHSSVWVISNGKTQLKTVTTGKTHGNMIEVLSGLASSDRLILNPQSIAQEYYSLL